MASAVLPPIATIAPEGLSTRRNCGRTVQTRRIHSDARELLVWFRWFCFVYCNELTGMKLYILLVLYPFARNKRIEITIYWPITKLTVLIHWPYWSIDRIDPLTVMHCKHQTASKRPFNILLQTLHSSFFFYFVPLKTPNSSLFIYNLSFKLGFTANGRLDRKKSQNISPLTVMHCKHQTAIEASFEDTSSNSSFVFFFFFVSLKTPNSSLFIYKMPLEEAW
jgi:hypothetical protein